MSHHRRYSIRFLFCVFLLPSYLLIAYLFLPSRPPRLLKPSPAPYITAYIPLSSRSIQSLNILLEPFTSTTALHIHQLVFLCSNDLFPDFRFLLSQLIDQEAHYHPGIRLNYLLRSIPSTNDLHDEILKQASEATTDWVLILDENGIDDISEYALQALRDHSTSPAATSPDMYDFISPPSYANHSTRRAHLDYYQDPAALKPPVLLQTSSLSAIVSLGDSISFLFPSIEVLYSAGKMLCGLLVQNYAPRILIYHPSRLFSSTSLKTLTLTLPSCPKNKLTIHQTLPTGQLSLLHWLSQPSKILFSVAEDRPLLDGLFSTIQGINTTRIYIPISQYPYTDWIGSLSILQLQHWHTPEITLSIITQNRPNSLHRLLHSLSPSSTLYFGDTTIQVRINIDHPSDPETKRLAQDFHWPHGSVQIHQRVLHGGLLPAIVESWYPHSNDSYGLLLEDDIELSPLFYAWVKFTILKYRYTTRSDYISPNLYGISLYQQKHLELALSGRRPFNARTLFSQVNTIPINTPYLSSIPCSWGAIYFPEHWREFHEYLSHRLSSSSSSARKEELARVPNVRSTKWTHSWKKYIIELVYLRGYVMLYPNYADFLSLSTNHLEIGSHVRAKVSPEKKDLFLLPLLQLPPITSGNTGSLATGLLDLPGGMLPSFRDLPVLNLTGSLTSLDALVKIGHEREKELSEAV